jgi:glycosyltransferase involved in cell wall biosynthesis
VTVIDVRVTALGDGAVDRGGDGAVDRGGAGALALERAGVALADVVVVPAVEDRAWTGLLLALAAGATVVASDLPTARELGVPVLVPPRDPAALAEAIAKAEAAPPREDLTDLEACGRALLG